VALAFTGRPRLIVLDEPTASLDRQARLAVWDAIRAHAAEGGALLLTTHRLDEAEALARKVIVIEAGSVVFDGSIADLRAATGLTP
jgi:ABC-2 type transport system ATP-binding protein